jgi:hypothetical protein
MNWYYAKNGAQHGPVSLEDMKSRIAMGEVSGTDLAWSEGMSDWMPVASIAELKPEPPASPVEGETPAASVPVPTASPEPYRSPASAPGPATGYSAPVVPGQVPSQGLAIGSLICGILCLLTCWIIYICLPLAIAAIVMGHVAMSKAKRNPQQSGGRGMAKAGAISGYLGAVASIVFVVAVVAWFFTLTPEKVDQMDWMPPESKQQMKDALRQMEEAKKGQGTAP